MDQRRGKGSKTREGRICICPQPREQQRQDGRASKLSSAPLEKGTARSVTVKQRRLRSNGSILPPPPPTSHNHLIVLLVLVVVLLVLLLLPAAEPRRARESIALTRCRPSGEWTHPLPPSSSLTDSLAPAADPLLPSRECGRRRSGNGNNLEAFSRGSWRPTPTPGPPTSSPPPRTPAGHPRGAPLRGSRAAGVVLRPLARTPWP
jgi:hypothetical protein